MTRPATVIAALGVAQTLSWGSTYYLPAVLANAIAAELGVETSTVFVAFSCALLLSALLGPLSGRLIDRYGGHWVLGGSNIMLALGLGLLGSATGATSLVLAWLVIGAGMSCGLYEAAFSSLARIYGADARRAITGITLIAGFASTICWPLSAWMQASLGWRDACFVWAAVQLALCLPLNLSLPRTRAAGHVGGDRPAGEAAAAPEGRLLTMAALSFVFAVTWFCSTAMAAHLPRLLQGAGASLAAAIAASALVGPAQVAARIVEFSIGRHHHPLHAARIASLAHPVGAAGLLALGAPAAPFFTVVHGGGNGVMTIANGTLPLALFGATGYGLRQGLLMAPARLVQASAPFVFDLLMARYGTAALLFTALLGVASFATLLMIPARRE
jgi:MFS family permease